jgi:homopolymeric O-antigen transport system permease protein
VLESLALNPLLFLWRQRHLILHTTLSDIRGRYAGSMLGFAWAILNPLLLLSVYVVLYAFILKIRLPGREADSPFEYTLVIFAGLIPWFGFAESTASSLASVVTNASLLHNTSFPAPVLPVKAVLAGMVGQLVGLLLLLTVLAARHHVTVYWLFLPVALGAQLALSLGLGWFLAPLNVFVRDLGQAISSILLFVMFASPIAFTADFVQGSPLRFILYLNPLSYLINLYRVPLVYGRAPALLDLVVAPLVGGMLFWGGFRFFVRIRPHLADHV